MLRRKVKTARCAGKIRNAQLRCFVVDVLQHGMPRERPADADVGALHASDRPPFLNRFPFADATTTGLLPPVRTAAAWPNAAAVVVASPATVAPVATNVRRVMRRDCCSPAEEEGRRIRRLTIWSRWLAVVPCRKMVRDIGGSHEGRHQAIVGPSNRSFGLLFTLVFAIVAAAPLWRGEPMRTWALAVAALFAIAALAVPGVLAPLNRLWALVGAAMHRVVNPVVMVLLFYGAVTPFGLFFQARRKGLASRLRRDPAADSYWISRAGQPASSMERQF